MKLPKEFKFRLSKEFWNCDKVYQASFNNETGSYTINGHVSEVVATYAEVENAIDNGFWRMANGN